MEENEKTEFKETLDEKKIPQTMAAFSNHKGGKIYVGIKDNGKVIGVKIGKNKIEQFTRKIHDEAQPTILFDTGFEKIENKTVLLISVQEAKRKPVFYRGVAYKRINKTTLRITDPEEIRSLIIHKSVFFDEIECVEATIKDIDEESIKKFIRAAESTGRLRGAKASIDEVLKKLDLMSGNKLKNGALMLFGKDPQRFFHTWGIKCAVISSNMEFLAMEDYKGNLMESIDKAMDFVNINIKKKISISGLRRVEKPVIPLEVIREALVNAAAHRDYFFPSFIYISLNPSYIEIRNPGKLEGITIEELARVHPSVIKNPAIAHALFLAGYIEKWGSGTLKMIRMMRENILKDPLFISNSMFIVRLDESIAELNEREKYILEEFKTKERMKPKQVAERYSVSIPAVIKDFKHLVRLGLLTKKGKGRTSYYELTKP